mmetsp:Transcript_44257/g.114991  ORF Transcript_44257/g.114991 Transcript_44257/m.114991 type:complete len:115 (+) Transcript_44257:212-556(+)
MKYYTAEQVAVHNDASDCWVSLLGKVFDLTKLLNDNKGPLAEPLAKAAGTDISHWFDKETGEVRQHQALKSGFFFVYFAFAFRSPLHSGIITVQTAVMPDYSYTNEGRDEGAIQ